MTTELDLWERLNRSAEALKRPDAAAAESKPGKDEAEQARKTRRRRRIIRTLDIVSTVIWLYWLITIFVTDIAGDLAGDLADYRFFAYVAVLVLGFLMFKRRMLLYIGYVVLFPLIVFAWKIPAFFIARKSWTLLLASSQAAFTFFADTRYNVVTKGIAILAALAIVVSDNRGVLLTASTYIGILILWSLVRLMRKTFAAPAFLETQRRQIDRVVGSEKLNEFIAIPAELRRTDVELYDQQQFGDVMTRISVGIFVTRGLWFWAYQLDRYRRTFSPAVIFNGISYAWLLVGVGVGFALINLAAFQMWSDQYEVDDASPSLIAMMLYSFASFGLQEAGGISANGDLAYAIQLAALAIGGILVISLVFNVVVTIKRERDETAMNELVLDLKAKAREREQRFHDEFAVTVDEARQRLETVAAGFAWLLNYVTATIPDEFLREAER